MIEIEDDREPTIPSQLSHPEHFVLDTGARVTGLADYPFEWFSLNATNLKLSSTTARDDAVLSDHSDDVTPELVSSSEEDEDDRPSALPSAVPGGTSAATPVDKVRTRRMILMDSLNYPDAVLCSESEADGSVAVAKMTMTLNEHAVGPEPTPKTSSRTARKARDNSGKRTGPATTVLNLSQQSGVMNRKYASRDESPSHRRSPSDPSFDTTSSASRSPIGMDNQRADGACAALTYSMPGDM